MRLYGGIDLHSTNNYMVLIDETGQINYKKRLPNDLDVIVHELKQFEEIESLVVESTYNWYWLGDGLMDKGYRVKLANPNAIKQYDGIKHTNDKTDARWLKVKIIKRMAINICAGLILKQLILPFAITKL